MDEGPRGSEAIINSRWLGASSGGCFSDRVSGNAARRRQGSRRCRVTLWRRHGCGRLSDLDGVGSLCCARRGRNILGNNRRGSGGIGRTVPPQEGTAKPEAKAVSAAGKNSPRPGRQSSVVTAAVTGATNLLEGAESRQSSCVARACENHEHLKRRKGAHQKRHSRDGVPAHSNQHRGLERHGCEARRPG